MRAHCRESNARHDFFGRQVDFAEAGDELGQRQSALATRQAAHRHARAARRQRHDGVVGRAGRDDIAGDRAAVADLRCAHFPAGARQRESLLDDEGAGDALIVRDQRAEMDRAAGSANLGEAWDARQVDDARRVAIRRLAHAALDLQQQVGGAGNDARPVAEFGLQAQCFVQRRG